MSDTYAALRARECGAGPDLHRELVPHDHPLRFEVPRLADHPRRAHIERAQARRAGALVARPAAPTRRGSSLAIWVPGIPNNTPGRAGHTMAADPRYVVLHTMVACEPSARARFSDPGQFASSTYAVKLDGGIDQYVSELDGPWTNSTLYDEPGANLDSITIEHEDCGNYDGPRTPALYRSSALLVRDICSFWGIPVDSTHIIRHRQCALAATACPDSLDVERIIAMAAGITPLPGDEDMDPELAEMIRNLFTELGVGKDGVTPGGVADLLLTRSKAQGERLEALAGKVDVLAAPSVDPAAVADRLAADPAFIEAFGEAFAAALAARLKG